MPGGESLLMSDMMMCQVERTKFEPNLWITLKTKLTRTANVTAYIFTLLSYENNVQWSVDDHE